jgi:multidrug efflux pump subunit AcrB
VGTSAPITFNGLVRHYDIRGGSNMADIQVNLIDKKERSAQSHGIASSMREEIQRIGAKYNANVKLVEVPPGPPVLSTIVGEIYGPDYETQIDIADQVQNILKNTQDVVDVDWMVEADQTKYEFIIDKEKAMLYGVTPQQIVHTMNMALSERVITNLYDEDASNQIGLILALDEKEKSTLQNISRLKVKSNQGVMMTIGDLVAIHQTTKAKSIYRKNQKRVVYVLADMAGELESPVYAILGMTDKLKEMNLPQGYSIDELNIKQPDFEDKYTVKRDGEWQIT